MRTTRSVLALILVAGTLAACSDTSGPNGEARVYLTGSSTAGNVAAGTTGESSFMAGIPLSSIDSINIVLTSIQAVNTSDSSGGVTLSLQGAGSKSINLMNLGSITADSTLLARGDLPAGTYDNVRLRFSSATITLKQAVTVGNANYPAGTYDLTVPSGLTSGIKVQGASFTVGSDASTSITLAFDPATTAGTIVATGSNKLMMSPVMHVRTQVGS